MPSNSQLLLMETCTGSHLVYCSFLQFSQIHAQKDLFKVPKICNINFKIENAPPPPPLALFQKSIRFVAATLPFYWDQTEVGMPCITSSNLLVAQTWNLWWQRDMFHKKRYLRIGTAKWWTVQIQREEQAIAENVNAEFFFWQESVLFLVNYHVD